MSRQIKPRLVISTVGTSLLANQIDSECEPDWASQLQDNANLTEQEINPGSEIDRNIKELKKRAEDKLKEANTSDLRETSAELNGIYGLYDDQLDLGAQDLHFLLTTDTAQGQVSAKILETFLRSHKISTEIYTPKNLSTASTEKFTNGIDELLKWIDELIPEYQSAGYKICFNLVGGFKALQGFANTIGMLYADEIIYIFEGSQDIITIPRLPIQVDKSVIKLVQFSLMAAGAWVKLSELDGVPETLILKVDDTAILTNWGRLIWNRSKEDLMSGELLQFPKLKYESSFIRDYDGITDKKEKSKLQETLAKVSHLLIKHNGDTAPLKSDGGVQYEVYQKEDRKQIEGLAHFRVTQALRVSCVTSGNVLILRHYGLKLHSPCNA
ncbi:putative CRISPR-associated protein [Microcoleus sp. AT9_B5]